MCGIVGVASTEGLKNRSSRLHFMKMGLDIDSWRGWESTGIALVPNASKEAPIVYKRALNGRDFIQLHQVDKYLNDIDKYAVAIGHNRAATTGRGNIIDHNAHPFQYGHITLVHNGHIRNTRELKGAEAGAQCQVDSAQVAFAMNANGEMETLEQVEGGFVFIWWNSDAGTLNIARNNERPMHWAFAAKENTFYWASELTQLLHLMKDIEIDEDIGILYPKPHNWYKFHLKDLRSWEKVPFSKSQGRRNQQTEQIGHNTTGVGSNGTEWSDEEIEAWTAEYEQTQRMRQGTTQSAKADLNEVEEIRQSVARDRLKDAKLSGVPTSRKRLLRAKTELAKLGIEFNSLKNCTPINWIKYKNQLNLGSALGRMHRGGHLIEVKSVRHEEYLQYERAGILLVDCVNVRNGPNGAVHVVGIVSPRMRGYLERLKNKEAASETAQPPNGGSIERNLEGPNGHKITLARFFELTDKGCAHCQIDIFPKDHLEIVWVGNPPSPICTDCSRDVGVMELIGFPEGLRQEGNIH